MCPQLKRAPVPRSLERFFCASSAQVHPGHSANYSLDCSLIEARPPLRRPKCGAFDFMVPLPTDRAGMARPVMGEGVMQPLPLRLASERLLRLSFRLKTFAWESEFDEPWLRAHSR
uniref:Uncharacterized protein n=1 Tax=Calcidiscus leptoporus TaxID=127549 RepID=A0A7S0IP45_9EUKA|mmetsp:Transcript_15286/g.35166  ORF Transcript_15286/g.35166 Transcript_15286/m.35166 type:complete len:116 (+) Transcript_15286:231-578(+)